MSFLVPGAAICGFIVREAMNVMPAVKKNEDTPDKFSWRYYFSQPANQLASAMNAAGTLGLMLAHKEVMPLLGKLPAVGQYLDGTAAPVLTGLLIGFSGAYVFRWLSDKWIG